MGQAVELGVLLPLAAGLETLLAPVETSHDQESGLETLAQAAAMMTMMTMMTSSLFRPAELGSWLSLEVGLGTSLPLLVELGTLLALAAGLQVFQD